jgi:hypothetical protein
MSGKYSSVQITLLVEDKDVAYFGFIRSVVALDLQLRIFPAKNKIKNKNMPVQI